MLNIRTSLRGLVKEVKGYLRNLFKKKRIAATHVLVLMLSDERRNKKPYALPIRYVPYRSLRDQYVRDLNRDVKLKMQEKELNLVGTVTDGEFCSLRSRGETRALHLWQLIHDARESVQKLSNKTLLEMLILIGSKLNRCKFQCVLLKKHVLVAFYSHIRLKVSILVHC